jgi:hypothetical protein
MHQKRNISSWILILCLVFFITSILFAESGDPLSQWNKGAIKKTILSFIEKVCNKDSKSFVPLKDRIAVFDMDGTIICESPIWLEANAAQEYLWGEAVKNPALLSTEIYKLAFDYHVAPKDPQTLQALQENCEDIMTGAFTGWDQEKYVKYVDRFIRTVKNPDYKIPLQQTFYAPMLQLIEYLLKRNFQVYIVSGSEQGLMWGACMGTVPLPRQNLVGTLIELTPKYRAELHHTSFVRGGAYLKPRDLKAAKPEHIYYQIGKTPILAFGNTADDFDMFLYTGTNHYSHIAFLVDHDDVEREYDYPDKVEKKIWKNAVEINKWNLVSMKDNFKTVFIKK